MTGFALTWRIWWMAGIGLVGCLGLTLFHAWRTHTEVVIPADEVAAFYGERVREEVPV